MSAFGSGSNSNGQFWYGNSINFPGFLYKKNVGVGGRRSTKMTPGGNTHVIILLIYIININQA